ncbi:ATPase family AAA domain-containing protein 5-like isoform X2 [Eriocheir sinensis]|uniref:ATPase family AAA domain-containing protein 5-like isoform X2 n=1 Tax=Eriocheir sinensis TaxID=95602 RepID=UPI0021C775CB|nr:ATPase family AAA domain-containing protein 5-like isoform X2 [Eriocheir sinensis]
MPLSAAVHESPHCGRGQRGIDFFFKSSPSLTSSVTEEKRDILAYFKRVEIAKDQEGQSYKSSLTSNSDGTEGSSSSSEGDEVKPGKSGVIRKKNRCDLSSNCKNNLNINEKPKPSKRQKNMTLDCDSENEVRAKDESAKVCNISEKVPKKPFDKGRPLNGNDTDLAIVCCKEGTTNDKNNPTDYKSSESKSEGCLEVESDGNTKDKEETKKSTLNESTEVRKNAFAFMMANRVRQTEAGKSSQEEKPFNHGEEEDGINIIYDNSCVIIDDCAVKKCEAEGKKNASLNSTASKKKNSATRKNVEKEDKDKSKDLDTSLQDFDLTPHGKPKKKMGTKPKNKEEKITTTSSCTEVAIPCDINHPSPSNDEKPSNCISFTDYIKSAGSIVKESAKEENIVKETDKIKKEALNESKTNELQQQQANSKCTRKEANEIKKREAISNPKTIEEQEQTTNSNCTLKEPDDVKGREVMSASKTNELKEQQTSDTNCTLTEPDEAKEMEEALPKSKAGEFQQQKTTNSTCTVKHVDEGAKKIEQQHQKTSNSNFESNLSSNILNENLMASEECDESVKKMKLVSSSEVNEKQDDQNITKEPSKAKQVAHVQRKRAKKTKIVLSDSDEDFKPSKALGASRERNSKLKEDSKSCDKPSASPSISSFFRKISQKEKDEEKNKTVITVQADVHAPIDGNETVGKRLSSPLHSQGCGELGETSGPRKGNASNIHGVRKNAQKVQKGAHTKCSLDELNKIELLEQIPPSKSVIKKGLRKVDKVDEDRNAEDSDTETIKSKTAVAPKRGELPKKKTLRTRKRNVKTSIGARKKSLRRKRVESSTSGEESSEELFIRQRSESPENDKDAVETKSSSSSISTNGCLDTPEKSNSVPQSSEASEDDKENVAHYTSQLLRQPGKLSLRLKRIHPPQDSCGKQKKLKLRKANKSPNHQQVKKILKRAKNSRSTQQKRRLCATQKQNPKEKAKKDLADAGQAQAMNTLIILDEDEEDSTNKQVSKKAAAKRKVSQTQLKPLLPKATKGLKKGLIQKTLKKSESEEKNDLQRRTPRRAAAAAARRYIEVEADENDKPKRSNKTSKKVVLNKAVKLAPIFCKRPASPSGVELLKVVPLSPSKLKARQEFLNSSVSDDVRKQVATEKSVEEEGVLWPPFPEVSHTQQREEGAAPWNLKEPQLPLQAESTYSPVTSLTFTPDYPSLKKKSAPRNVAPCHVPHLELGDIILSLSCMKTKYPDFPVYEVFKAYYEMKKEAVESYQKEVKKEEVVIDLHDEEEQNSSRRKKRKGKNKLTALGRGKRRKLDNGKEATEETQQNQQEEFKSLWHEKTPHMWTQIFMPKNASQVIGNSDNVTKLKLWLQEWKNKPQIRLPKRKKKSSKKDDFVVSDESTYGNEEDEFVSTYLLCGPPGVGKTAAVYALASELGYKVLEVNASSRRPGRQVMSQLAEATQSHSVSNTSATASQSSNAFTALFSARSSSSVTKKDNSQKEYSLSSDKASNKTKGVSLVLFEDIDIVFDEWDEGFMSTVNSLMATTKRPIILTATHACPILFSRIKESFEVMEFVKPPQKLTAQHLQLVALANGCHICPHDAECLVHLNKGDIRKSVLDLQLMSQSGSSHENCDCTVPENIFDDVTMESCRAIFPQAETYNQKTLKKAVFYKVELWRKLNAKPNYNPLNRIPKAQYLCDNEDISWEEVESNLNSVLPFPVNEREKTLHRYPLQSDDPLLKKSTLGMYESLLCLDDEQETEPEPVTQAPEKEKSRDSPGVQKASHSCLKSLSNLYDSVAQLDILSSQITTNAEIKDLGWWVKQPSAGLSDNPGVTHSKWRPCSNEDIIQEFAQRAIKVCGREIASALEEVSAKDWPQLSLPCDKNEGTQSCIMQSTQCEWERAQKRSVINRISSQLPALNQLSHGAVLDYLPALRSFARQDELGAAMGRRKRGRRFLSHFLQLGWTISPSDRISLANALIT